jgi:hypothetical protein
MIQVRILHDRREGYPSSADGQEIKEQLQLEDFLRRIFEPRQVDNEMRRVERALHTHDRRQVEMICDKYNDMYLHLIRSGKAVLAQHRMSGIGAFGVDPFNDHNHRQRQMGEREQYEYERAMMMRNATPNYGLLDRPKEPKKEKSGNTLTLNEKKAKEEAEVKKKRDDDLFYLTT